MIIYLIGVILSIILWLVWKWNYGKDDILLIDVMFILAISVMSYISVFGAIAAICYDLIETDWNRVLIRKNE